MQPFDFEKIPAMTADELKTAIEAQFPNHDKKSSLAYLAGATRGIMLMGAPEDVLHKVLGEWSTREENMLVASLWACEAGKRDEVDKPRIFVPDGKIVLQ